MRPRGRPKKKRIVKKEPIIYRFSPRGKAGRPDEVDLAMDEFEALRLADYLGMSQRKAARSMNVSQQTFSRILKRARRIIADVLVNGKIIKILGTQEQANQYLKSHQIEKDLTSQEPIKE